MTESEFYSRFVGPNLAKWGHVCRVENSLGQGTPDVNYAIHGVQGWVELKVIKHGLLYLEKFQPNWIAARWRHCHDLGMWVMASDEQATTIFMWPGVRVVKAPKTPVRKWLTVKVEDMGVPLKFSRPFNWSKIVDALTGDSA